MLEKELLRETALLQRSQLQMDDYLDKSSRAANRLMLWKAFSDATSVLLYASKEREVFTHALIRDCLKSGKKVALPRANRLSQTIELYAIKSFEDLSEGSYGILEPFADKNRSVEVYECDFAVIPGACFDQNGFRIGYGKGYYDKLLAGMRDSGRICALAFESQLVHAVPHESFDVPADFIFTENRIIDCAMKRKKSAKEQA